MESSERQSTVPSVSAASAPDSDPDIEANAVANAAGRRRSDGPVELLISWLLRLGVWSSIAVIVGGLLLAVTRDRTVLLHKQPGGLEGILTHGLPGQPMSISNYGAIISAVRHGQSLGVIMLGLLILLLTPVLRVAVSVVAFLLERDRLYALITLVVLGLLMVGIVLGKAGG